MIHLHKTQIHCAQHGSAENIFWAPQPTFVSDVDEAMAAIERDNPSLKGVLSKDYARPGLDKQRLGQVINLMSDIGLDDPSERARDTLGRVYEYSLSRFASAEGKSSGTPGRESRTLASLRDTLLPKPISGELRIPDAERFLERVTA